MGPVEVRFRDRRCFTGARVLGNERRCWVRFRNRRCFTGAMVLGNQVLLGAIPMEDMDLVLRPQLQSLDLDAKSPNFALSVA